jgi:hypothetical protein
VPRRGALLEVALVRSTGDVAAAALAVAELVVMAVTDAADPRQNKAAVDAICRKLDPEYLMILGAPDVVPHQDLRNPIAPGAAVEDPDRTVPGDLPYCCDAPYSRDVATFKGPTRVVGRLPDLTGGTEPSHLLTLLAHAAAFFYPHQPGTIVAITGTSGKTSVSVFTRQLWQALGVPGASLGTIGIVTHKGAQYGSLTTPDPIELHQILQQNSLHLQHYHLE